MPGIEHLHPEMFLEHLTPDGDAPQGVFALTDAALLAVTLVQIPAWKQPELNIRFLAVP